LGVTVVLCTFKELRTIPFQYTILFNFSLFIACTSTNNLIHGTAARPPHLNIASTLFTVLTLLS
jgi:hypothetical protein